MQKPTRVRIIKLDRECHIVDAQTGFLLEAVETLDNLDEALSLLKKINLIKTADGTPIYKLRLINGTSAWSFNQTRLYWENVRHFVRFGALVKVLLSNGYAVVVDSGFDGTIASLLKQSGVSIHYMGSNLGVLKPLKIKVANAVFGAVALGLGYITLFALSLFKREVLVYSPDKYDKRSGSDFRMADIYKYLKNHSVSYVEVFHSTLGMNFVKNMLNRRRLGLYLEFLPARILAPEGEAINPDLSAFEDWQKAYITNLVLRFDNLARQGVAKVETLQKLIQKMGLKVLVTIDDTRSSQEIITACRALGLKSYGFQHGHINKYHTGHMNYEIPRELSAPFDMLYTWNEYWKEKLITYSSVYNASNVTTGGYMRIPRSVLRKSLSLPSRAEDLSVIFPSDTWAPKSEVAHYINRFLELGSTVYLGIRPDLPMAAQVKNYGVGPHPNLCLALPSDYGLLESVNCVAGVYSTYLYEMMYHDIPVFALQTSFTFGEDLIKDNLAYKLDWNFTFADINEGLSKFSSKKDIVWPKQSLSILDTLDTILGRYVKS